MRGLALMVVLVASGCSIESNLVDCGDGRACPATTVCAILIENEDELCVHEDDLGECEGVQALAGCLTRDGVIGACYASDAGLVCLESGCGNDLIDVGEVCDDGNAITGDGCSVGCTSNETCGNGIVDPLTRNEECDDHNMIAHDGCASTCLLETVQWSLLVSAVPEARYATAMAYDSGRDRIVMFGGGFQAGATGSIVAKGDTWEWNGIAWLRMPTPTGPSARVSHVAVYDVARRRVVMFSGANAGYLFDDMWQWDGSSWQQIATGTPIKRRETSAVYDPVRERIVIFGGLDDTGFLADTWEWDGTVWTQRMIPGPPARSSAGLVFDPRRGVIVLVGGQGPAGRTNDVWEYDGSSWVMKPVVTPIELVDSAFAFDGGGILAFGGDLNGSSSANTWRYDGSTWMQLAPADVPIARRAGRMVRDPIRNRIILFGGHSDINGFPSAATTRDDPRAWNGTTWVPIVLDIPVGRSHQAMAYDALRGRVVMVGGSAQPLGTNPSFAETWEFDGHSWLRRAAQPSARSGVGLAYDPVRMQTVLFGGRDQGGTALADTQLWDGTSWTTVVTIPSESPPARHGHAMAFDPVRGRIVMHGGLSGSTFRADTWEWTGSTWTIATATAPLARMGHTIVHDPVRQRMRMFGGQGPSSSFADLWEYDGSWSNVTPAGLTPPPRGAFGMAWNGVRQRMMMFGGQAGTFSLYDDVWELGDQWTQLFTPNPPSSRGGVSLAPLSDGTGVFVFGGVVNPGVLINEVRRLRWENAGTHEICTLDVDDDNDGLTGCADPDCWSRCTPLCPPGVTCDPSWPKCGDGSCNAAIESSRSCPTDCAATSPVCGDNFCDPGETIATCTGDCS